MDMISWTSPSSDFILGNEAVHIWSASLHQHSARAKALEALLTADELERANSFRFERHRRQFVVGRGLLREILSRYLAKSPAAIRFSYNAYGKPALAPDQDGLRFNLAHSHEVAVYGLTRGTELGVDLEFLRDDFASLEIAEQFFSPAEVSMFRSLPVEQRTQGFFNCWTRKEAYIKAMGEGLSHPLHRFAVSFAPGEPARLLSGDNDLPDGSRWSIVALDLFPGYAAALALKGNKPNVHCWSLA